MRETWFPSRERAEGERRSRRGPFHVLDPDLDLGDRQSRQALDLVQHTVPQCRRHLGKVEAVLDDDAQLDGHAFLSVAADADKTKE